MNNATINMNRILISFIILLTASFMQAQKAKFTGIIKGLKTDSHVTIMNTANLSSMVPVKVDAYGNYCFELDVQEPHVAFLYVDDPRGGTKIYVEKDMMANIDIEFTIKNNAEIEQKVTYRGDNKDAFDFLLEGDYFQNIHNPAINKYYNKNLNPTFAEFREELEYLKDLLVAKLNKVKSPFFRKLMKADYEQKMYIVTFPWFHLLSNNADKNYRAWMESLERDVNYQEAKTYMDAYKIFYLPKDEDRTVGYFKVLNNLYTNHQIINALADEEITGVLKKAPSNINEVFQAYKAVEPSRKIPPKIKALYEHFKTTVSGAKAIDFEMYDVKGNKVMLSMLKGKALYVDCWATWCGPCREEMPHMVKLFEYFKNDKRIKFVGMSIDENKKAWEGYIKKEPLIWPQYILKGGYNSSFCKEYGVTGIPYFFMIDKSGHIISLDAPRPSDPNIIRWIENNLK